jgi:NADH-quinone oxidoreductase subunit G
MVKLSPIQRTANFNEALSPMSFMVRVNAGFAEKRGSMVNVNGRIQRLNRATQPPGQARDEWEILSDLLRALGAEVPPTLEGIFKEISAAVPAFAGLTLAQLGGDGIPANAAAS